MNVCVRVCRRHGSSVEVRGQTLEHGIFGFEDRTHGLRLGSKYFYLLLSCWPGIDPFEGYGASCFVAISLRVMCLMMFLIITSGDTFSSRTLIEVNVRCLLAHPSEGM